MSVQFGRWNLDGKPVSQGYLDKVKPVIAPYGPDDSGSYAKTSINILYRAFHTTKESRHETQPHVTESGAVITWDGRLDNRAELIRQLRDVLTVSSPDVSIVAAAYQEWGTDCLAKLIGDWALSIWDEPSRSLILAKDPIGTRHLYYSIEKDEITWSTILDPLVLFASRSFALNEEYIAGWFSFFPAAHLTPYVGIHSVPPSSSVAIRAGKHAVSKYWDFDPARRIRYRTDSEYEEHFRAVFSEAVRRRLRSDSPILAELSGGMDSSSVVCIADTVIARGSAETPRLDTVSYYNDSEPNWNERPYFTKVEEKRGRTGTHIDVGAREFLKFEFENESFRATPGSHRRSKDAAKQFAECTISQGNRVLLSGIGGDEVMGGVPTPTPELEDLLARAQFGMLPRRLKVWALNKRKPWFYLLFESVRGLIVPPFVGVPKYKRRAPWLNQRFARRNQDALRGYETKLKLFGPLPSFQQNLSALDALRRQLESDPLSPEFICEKRYPYLDRSLLEFIYAIPREQLVRPGQRRSLMRRGLAGIVPDELLKRRRKAYVSRTPMAVLSTEWANLVGINEELISAKFGIVNQAEVYKVVRNAMDGHIIPVVSLMRTLSIEMWLRNLTGLKKVGFVTSPKNELGLRVCPQE